MKTKSRVLIIDDDPACHAVIERALGDEFLVQAAMNGDQGIKLLQENSFDLLLLDVLLPDSNGFQFYTNMLKNPRFRHLSTIFLTSQSEISYKVLGLNLGAADYIVKPFNPLELRARVAGRIRNLKENHSNFIFVDNIEIDVINRKISLTKPNGEIETIEVTPVELRLLCALIRSEGQPVSRDDLIKTIWNKTFVSDRTIDRHLSALRQKAPYIAACIQTHVGFGYEFLRGDQKLKKIA